MKVKRKHDKLTRGKEKGKKKTPTQNEKKDVSQLQWDIGRLNHLGLY